MELPICYETYSNESAPDWFGFLGDVFLSIDDYYIDYRAFFVGLCYNCKESRSPTQSLQRCGGCQLVGYCSRDCQKQDRSTYKFVCKEFPVVNGLNALYTTGPWKEHLAGLRERAARLPHAEIAAKPIFQNPRVCNNCQKSRHDHLTDCECNCQLLQQKLRQG